MLNDHRAALVQTGEGHPVCRAVHEWGGRQSAHCAGTRRLGDGVERLVHLPAEQLSTQRPEKDIMLSPQHPLRESGRAPGIENVQIVRRPLDCGTFVRGPGQRFLVIDCTRKQRVPGIVRNLQQHSQMRQRVANRGNRRGKTGMVDQDVAIGVIEQVDELVFDVAVVDVERGNARLVCADHAFEVFVTVVQIEAKVVLARFKVLQRGTLAVAPESMTEQQIGRSSAAPIKLVPREAAIAEDDTLTFWNRGGDRFVYSGQREFHGAILSSGACDANG